MHPEGERQYSHLQINNFKILDKFVEGADPKIVLAWARYSIRDLLCKCTYANRRSAFKNCILDFFLIDSAIDKLWKHVDKPLALEYYSMSRNFIGDAEDQVFCAEELIKTEQEPITTLIAHDVLWEDTKLEEKQKQHVLPIARYQLLEGKDESMCSIFARRIIAIASPDLEEKQAMVDFADLHYTMGEQWQVHYRVMHTGNPEYSLQLLDEWDRRAIENPDKIKVESLTLSRLQQYARLAYKRVHQGYDASGISDSEIVRSIEDRMGGLQVSQNTYNYLLGKMYMAIAYVHLYKRSDAEKIFLDIAQQSRDQGHEGLMMKALKYLETS